MVYRKWISEFNPSFLIDSRNQGTSREEPGSYRRTTGLITGDKPE